MNKQERTTMSVREMGQMLGLGKTDSYWLVHRMHFETTLVQGVMRVNIESFEHWYANQIKYKKIDGTPPGEELRAYSYSVAEMAELLDVSIDIAYSLLKRCDIETFTVDTWMRIRKDVFERWYRSQTKYRTKEDRERDAERERSSMTFPQMAKLLGITRDEVYAIIGKKKNRGIFDIIVVADKKRVTLESFEAWYQNQNRYQKVSRDTSGLQCDLNEVDDSKYRALLSDERSSFTPREAALLIGVPQREVYRMIEAELLDSFTIGKMIRIRRSSLEWWLTPPDTAFGKEDR